MAGRNGRTKAIRSKKCRSNGPLLELPGGLIVKPVPCRVLAPSTHVTPLTVFGGW